MHSTNIKTPSPTSFESIFIRSPASLRRFDSIAYLIQGDATCGAAAFDGVNLILATNDPLDLHAQQTLVNNVLGFLKKIITTSRSFEENATHQNLSNNSEAFKDKYEILKQQHNSESVRFMKDFAQASSLARNNQEYINRSFTAIQKIILSIRHTCVKSGNKHHDVLPEKLIEVIQNYDIPNNAIRVLIDKQNIPGVHAELKILQYLYDKYDMKPPHIYIGISKKRCLNCENTFKAYNSEAQQQLEEDMDSDAEDECSQKEIITKYTLSGPTTTASSSSQNQTTFTTRNPGHGYPFKAAPPKFFQDNLPLQKKFLLFNQKTVTENTQTNFNTINSIFIQPPPEHVPGHKQLTPESDSPPYTSETFKIIKPPSNNILNN